MFRRIAASLVLALTIAACGVVSDQIEVTSLTPEDGATGVPVDVQLEATFDREIDESTLEGNFSLSGPAGDVAGTVAYDAATQTATFTPDADLAFDTTYTATIAGSVATVDGVSLGGAASWSFTTAEEVAPSFQITSLTPSDGATGVAVDTVLEAEFNEDVDESTLTGAFSLSGPADDVAGTVAYDAATLTATFTPDADLALDTTYTATIAGSVATSEGDTLGDDATWSFTTAAEGDAIGAIVVTPENPDPIAVDGNTTVQLSAEATGVTGSPDTNVTWSSDAEGIATVDDTGLVTAVAAGTATITATSVFDDTLADSVTVTVAEPLVAGSDYLANVDAGSAIDPVLTPADPSPGIGADEPLFTGGEAPFSFAISTSPDTELGINGLPPGVTLDTTTGEISGAPVTAGFYREAIDVTDAAGQTIEVLAEITVLFVFEYAQTTYAYDPATPGEVVPASDVTIEGDDGALTFSMTLLDPDPTTVDEDTFTIDPITGAITLEVTPVGSATWTYQIAVCDDAFDNCGIGEITDTFEITLEDETTL